MNRRGTGLILAALLGVVAAGCAPSVTQGPEAPTESGPGATADLSAAGARSQIAAALAARNLVLDDARVPFVPPEPPDLAAVPRAVYQVELKDDPDGGFIVVYALASPAMAAAAGRSMSAYLGTGPGRVQAPIGTIYVIRQLGASLIAYHWLPGAIVDPNTPGIQEALESLGVGVPVPR